MNGGRDHAMDARPAAMPLPWTKSCFVCGEDNPCGLHARAWMEGEEIVIRRATREADRGYRHIMHGGLAMTLMDEVMTWAAIVCARRVCVAAEIRTRLLRPIGIPAALEIRGRVTEDAGRLFYTEARVLQDGRVMARADGKYVPMPADQAGLCEKDFVVGPGCLKPEEFLEFTGDRRP